MKKFSESAESCRRAEITRLRQMAAEASARGERAEAYKLDALADAAAQRHLLVVKAERKKRAIQLSLWDWGKTIARLK